MDIFIFRNVQPQEIQFVMMAARATEARTIDVTPAAAGIGMGSPAAGERPKLADVDRGPLNVSVVVNASGSGNAGVGEAGRGPPGGEAAAREGMTGEQEALRSENEALKGDVVAMLAALGARVDVEYFRYILAVLAKGSVLGAAGMLGIANSTLAARLKGFAGRGKEYRRLYELIVVKPRMGVRSFVQFNEEFLKHQPEELQDEGVLQAMLEGLEGLHAGNLESVRTELLGILKEVGVEGSGK